MVFGRGKSTSDLARTYSWPNEYKGENIMYKLPTNIYYNDNIVVVEDEFAVFLRDGKAMHIFDQAGRYALTTQNVPILSTILPALTGVKQLGEIYYLQKRELKGKFGTPEPLTFRDSDFGLVRLRVFGQFAYKVVDPLQFITQFVGTRGWSGSDEVIEWLRSELIQSVNDVLNELKRDRNMTLVGMPAYLNEIEQIVHRKIHSEVIKFGLAIINLTGITITAPEDVQEAISRRQAMGALGVEYMRHQPSKIVESTGAPQRNTKEVMKKCLVCGAFVVQDAKFCAECGAPMMNVGSIKCPNCRSSILSDAKYCNACGEPLGKRREKKENEQKEANDLLNKAVSLHAPQFMDTNTTSEILVVLNNTSTQTLTDISLDISQLEEDFEVTGTVAVKTLSPGKALEQRIKIKPRYEKGTFPVKIIIMAKGARVEREYSIKVGGTEIY